MTSQNLVTNPSFEEATFCPNKHGDFNNNVKFWSTPTNGTSDYFNQCSSYFSSKNPHGYQQPYDKKAYAGIVTYYENKENWVTISGYYTALGYENYLIVGNFKNSEQIKTKKVASTTNIYFSFYYIDDIIIEPLISESEKEKLFQMNQKEFKTEKTYTFKNVLFDFDKAILLNQSIKELNQLSEHLKTHPELTIEIYGHTDNVGLKSRNKELSQQRAEAVSKYLIEKGLNKKHIKWFGFGAEQPVVKNDTDKNRSLNRRVNFKLIEL
jgi:outer membrane protein OmpA-like peptidoglycan-associated protein